MRTAILGATGYIGESLARAWGAAGGELFLFARRPEAVSATLGAHARPIDAFDAVDFELVINAIGAGDPTKVGQLGEAIIDITRHWDSKVLKRLRPDARYIFLSSGAVHSPESLEPYTVSKRQAEAVHRALYNRAILDLRVFGYAEANINLDSGFFLAQLARSVVDHVPFRTDRTDMVRDYAGAAELKALIDAWLASGAPNAPFDLYTLAPVSKLELIDTVQVEFGLAVEWVDSVAISPTGVKPTHVPLDRAATNLGYRPRKRSLDIVRAMLRRLALA